MSLGAQMGYLFYVLVYVNLLLFCVHCVYLCFVGCVV